MSRSMSGIAASSAKVRVKGFSTMPSTSRVQRVDVDLRHDEVGVDAVELLGRGAQRRDAGDRRLEALGQRLGLVGGGGQHDLLDRLRPAAELATDGGEHRERRDAERADDEAPAAGAGRGHRGPRRARARSASPEAPARRASQTRVATPAAMAARAGSASSGRAAGRSSAAAPASPVSSTMKPTASGIRRRASRPATAARTSVTTRTEPCRISLSLVPKVAIAHSLTGVGVRSMTVDPMASTGDDAGARKPATRWPAAIPATAARIPLRANRRRVMPGRSAREGDPDCPDPPRAPGHSDAAASVDRT